MVSKLRCNIAERLTDAMKLLSHDTHTLWCERMDRLKWCVRLNKVTKRLEVSKPQVSVSMNDLRDIGLLESIPSTKHESLLENLAAKINADSFLQNVSATKDNLSIGINQSNLTQAVLSDIQMKGGNYGRSSGLYDYMPYKSLDDMVIEKCLKGQTVVVEYSSPNIAKPFHAGHLRSTILGQFVSNINEWFGQKVIRINYLGDWGTQFGLLAVGFKKYGSLDCLKSDPLQHLFDVYVQINKDASSDESVHAEAMAYFKKMEEGETEALDFWNLCRQVSVDEYTKIYERLGVHFTHIHGEAMYSRKSRELVADLKAKGLLSYHCQTGIGYMDLTQPQDKVPVYGNLVKSDGTSLYLTRDVVAALDRRQQFSCDKFYYVVENGQHLHFKQLLRVLRRLGQWWAVHLLDDVHIKFGRVEGMSTRHGEVVFLRDILDEAKSLMLLRMRSKNTTKVVAEDEQSAVAEALGVSAILVQDLKEHRQNNYKFSWERMLNFNGDTGVFLQYTHARLHSLSSNVDQDQLSTVIPDFASLQEDLAQRLVRHLARFDEVLLKSYAELEPCHLVQYLFTLGRLVNVAHSELYVKGMPSDVAKDRLILFESSRIVLSVGLKILGINPLNQI